MSNLENARKYVKEADEFSENEEWEKCAALDVSAFDFYELAIADFKKIIDIAKKWWESKRPTDYSLEEHIKNPEVNTHSEWEKKLATAIVEFIKQKDKNGY